jgi:putative endonuclease
MERQYYVYIMTNERNTVLYTGVTNDLKRRVLEHKNRVKKGSTRRYNVNKLVYFEAGGEIDGVILREKQIKAGSRADKIELINSMNSEWCDLFGDI